MSYTHKKNFFKRIIETRSIKSLSYYFMLNTMLGQKVFLFNQDLPRVINISFNERTCMYKCRMCPFFEKEIREIYKTKSEMNFTTLQNLVKNIPNDPYYSFDISSIGETLEFEPLAEFIKYMKTQKPLVNTIISTNGLLLNEKTFIKLIDSGLDNIQISLFAENEDDHFFISGTKTFDKVCENIKSISAIKKARKGKTPFLQVFMIETQETKEYSGKFIEKWSNYVDKAFIRPMYNAGRNIEGLTPTFENNLPRRYPCVTPWYSTAIRSNGDVLACYNFHWHKSTIDDMVIGNINDSSLSEIWYTKKFKVFRSAHLKLELHDYPVCEQCNLWAGYTNIWQRENNIYNYPATGIGDFFTKSPEHRGG